MTGRSVLGAMVGAACVFFVLLGVVASAGDESGEMIAGTSSERGAGRVAERGDGRAAARIAAYPPATYFVSDAEPVHTEVIGNPLDFAGARLGIDIRNFTLPRGHEGNYRFACRFPIIDFVSHRPLYMKQWAEENAAALTTQHIEHGIGALPYALGVLRGTSGYPDVGSGESAAVERDLALLDKRLAGAGFTTAYRAHVGDLCRAYLEAIEVVRLARENLTADDIAFLDANPGYFLAPDGKAMPSLTGNVETHFEFVEHARRVRYECIFKAAEMLGLAIEQYSSGTAALGKADIFEAGVLTDQVFEFDTSAGPVVIAGFADDRHERDAALTIDLGGSDTYTNNAGGCQSAKQGVAVAIDHAGNDEYLAGERRYVQGFGFVGVGLLVDIAGNDRYEAQHFAQGAGIMGVGAIWDKAGDDIYAANAFCQGAGMFGLGMLLDDAGEDFYDCATVAQGGATTLGLGILSDLEGDDRYYLAVDPAKDALGNLPGYGQGGALSFRHMPWKGKLTAYGGVGMLVDASGNDRYRSNGWCDQGGSYIMSLGALVDLGGNDHYSSGTGQGSGIHITNAILVDKAGHDIYEGGFRSGGSGGDRTPAFLIDYAGDDIYKSRTSSYGTGCKPFCLSLFLDYGGADTYICPEPKGKITFNNWDSFGGVWPESEAYLWPYAICLDLGGKDDYQVRNRADNTERQSFGHGIHVDMEWRGGDVIGEVEIPLEPYGEIALPEGVVTSPYYDDVKMLQNPDTFIRFQAIGRIMSKAGATAEGGCIAVLAEAIKESSHRQFNRDVMEGIHYLVGEGKTTPEDVFGLIALLNAVDEEVRTLIADDFGVYRIKEAEDALLKTLKSDRSDQVRRFALRSLIEFKSVKALPLVRALAVDDPSEDVRRLAVTCLSRVRDEEDPFPTLAQVLALDPASSVRVAAAQAIGEIQDPRGIAPLREAAQSGDVYLARAAGKSLAELYEVDGIGILIESLSFPSIDAFYNYDRNVPNTISAYVGFDMPEEERYDQDRWSKWFEKSRNKIDIRANVEAARALAAVTESLVGATPEQEIEKYEEFLVEYPGSARAKKVLSEKLNQVAWDMVTAPAGSERRQPQRGLKYALRAVELNPSPNFYDTLAEAYLANGNIAEAETVCREMLADHPGEQMFIEKMGRIARARGGSK